ncbi:hypothetical protein HYT74_03405 [Candidatus Daviesbacteria bacterium]|nr:hypothetical protein [Candidatus Daviesbacteria bacterium]
MTKSRVQLISIIILVFLVGSLLLSVKANPDMPPFFALKRGQEKVFLKLKSTPSDRVYYMSSLLETRLQELQSQVNNKSYGYILPSASRYSTLAGQITELVVANNMKDKVGVLISQFERHKKVLDELYVIYPKNTDNMEYKYIQDDFNYLGLYLDQLSKVK